jgi:single-stranded DNA-binding protein
MAVQVTFEGYVNEVKAFQWGNIAKVSHSQRAKNDATGQWETVGKDYFDVTIPEGVSVAENSLVSVTGNLKVGTYAKQDGSTGISLKVRASSISAVERKGGYTADAALSSLGAEPTF